MQCRISFANACRHLLPYIGLLAFEERAVCDGLRNELGPLIEDSTRADRVVPDLTIAHVEIGRHSDGLTVCNQLARWHRFGKPIKRRRTSEPDRVGIIASTAAYTIHHTDHNRPGNAWKIRILGERPFTHSSTIYSFEPPAPKACHLSGGGVGSE